MSLCLHLCKLTKSDVLFLVKLKKILLVPFLDAKESFDSLLGDSPLTFYLDDNSKLVLVVIWLYVVWSQHFSNLVSEIEKLRVEIQLSY